MRILSITFFAAILVFLYSCENENNVLPEETEDNDTIQTIDYADQIMIGQTTDMITRVFNDTLTISDSDKTIFIDVDRDSIDDFSIRRLHNLQNWQNIHPFLYFSCLHEGSKVLGFVENDSVYYFKYYEDGSRIETYLCYETINHDSSSSLYSVNEDPKLETIYRNEMLHKNDSFITDTINLAGTYSIEYFSSAMDQEIWDLTCDDLSAGEFTYVGIKLMKENKERLGWIKIFISEDKQELAILECNIQQ